MKDTMLFLSASLVITIWTGLANAASSATPNNRPVIGILTQEPRKGLELSHEGTKYNSYIPLAYVKYFEAGGAQVIPVFIDRDLEYYKNILDSVNGLVFPGDESSRTSSAKYENAAQQIYELVLEKSEAGINIPLMGISRGFQTLLNIASETTLSLTVCHAMNMATNLKFKDDLASQIFGEAPKEVLDTLKNGLSTSNFHERCITRMNFKKAKLGTNFNIVSTSVDDEGMEYIAAIEHKKLPVYGLQFHPERNLFEWGYDSIPHDRNSVRAAQYIANFFVQQARQVPQEFESEEVEANHLIYKYLLVNTRDDPFKPSLVQRYLFE